MILIGVFSLVKLQLSRVKSHDSWRVQTIPVDLLCVRIKAVKVTCYRRFESTKKVVLADQPRESTAVLGGSRPFHGIFFQRRLTRMLINMRAPGGSKPCLGILSLGCSMTLDQPKPVKAMAWDRSRSFC